jgi:cell wall-associated NlpC family hydrolase
MSRAPSPSTIWRRGAARVGVPSLAAVAFLAVALAGCGATDRTAAGPRGHLGRRSTYVAEAPDPLANESYPQPAGAPRHVRARAPRKVAREAFLSPGAPSDQQVLSELQQEKQAQESAVNSGPWARVDATTGKATPSAGLPIRIQDVIAGGNAIADFPYVYGGGHLSFIDDAYDCSGSVSYALAAGGLIKAPETSGQLKSWGVPGPGRYLTVFATVGHTFMWVDGLWFDTAGRSGPYSTRWLTARPSLAGYVERHYPGL